jgi:hypothetical protein
MGFATDDGDARSLILNAGCLLADPAGLSRVAEKSVLSFDDSSNSVIFPHPTVFMQR